MNKEIKNLVLSALFLAIGIVLPFITGQIKEIGSMLLPMHIPVILCGLICDAPYGFIVGFILPMFRSILFGIPPLFPLGLAMSVELATYGLVAGYLYNKSKYQCIIALYKSLIPAMFFGRVVWGVVSVFFYGITGKIFTYALFIGGAFINAIPGIIIQLILIPVIMVGLDKTCLVRFKRNHKVTAKI